MDQCHVLNFLSRDSAMLEHAHSHTVGARGDRDMVRNRLVILGESGKREDLGRVLHG